MLATNHRIPGHGLPHSPEKTWTLLTSKTQRTLSGHLLVVDHRRQSPKYPCNKQYRPDQSPHKHWIEEWKNHIYSATEDWTIPNSQIQFFALSWRTLIQRDEQKRAKRNAAEQGCIQKYMSLKLIPDTLCCVLPLIPPRQTLLSIWRGNSIAQQGPSGRKALWLAVERNGKSSTK